MGLTQAYRGEDYCPECGARVKWIRLISGRWIDVEPSPVLYIPGAGRHWLIEGRRYDADILKDCDIWKPGKSKETLKKGYYPHAFTRCGRKRG